MNSFNAQYPQLPFLLLSSYFYTFFSARYSKHPQSLVSLRVSARSTTAERSKQNHNLYETHPAVFHKLCNKGSVSQHSYLSLQ